MALFPRLKTGAVAQFPSQKKYEYSTEVLRFLDGTEQRFRRYPAAIERWEIALDLLDEVELRAVEAFHSAQAGCFGTFEFFDPWDEVEYSDCSFENDRLEMSAEDHRRGRTKLVIRRNRA